MNLSPLGLTAAQVASPLPAMRADVTAAELVMACRAAADQGARLVALWAADDRDRDRGFHLRVLLIDADGLALLDHRLPDDRAVYPDLAGIFPAANRMQRATFDLAVPLASDEDGKVSDAFGTWVEKSMYGRKYMGMERATYLIGADGKVLRAWRKVKVPGHAQEVLKAAAGASN